ncbi:hypothetical protein AAF712_011216 [Marasmius tenuissimus]|uniref:Uncharacterized protein n=1 Tax=Marasmius tenuissimus TaxID=585030 RepID=A0ABR2ZNG8_9AGAR
MVNYAASASLVTTALLFSGAYALPQGPAPEAVTINTPTNLVTCEPTILNWSGGTPPYFLSMQDGNNFNGPAIKRFDQQSTTSFTWTVSVPAGKSVAFLLRDSAGHTSITAPVSVEKGAQDTCADQSLTFAPPSNGTSSAGASPTSGSSSTNTAASGDPAPPAQDPSSSASDTAAGSQNTSNGAAATISGVILPALGALFGIMFAI